MIKQHNCLSFEEIIDSIKSEKKRKFDESLDVSLNISSKNPLSIRGYVKAPHALKRNIKIAAFTHQRVDVAYSGVEDLIERFTSRENIKCDMCIADETSCPLVAKKVGKVLGRKRMMPDAKFGTVANDIDRLVEDLKHGIMFFRSDKPGKRSIIHSVIGKLSMSTYALKENLSILIQSVRSNLVEKSAINSVYISKTMGGAFALDIRGIS